jgi:two-component system, OmpR family, sensor kinase
MSHSFRDLLALRFAAITAVGMALCVAATFLVLRHILDGELNASVLNVASIQAAALTDEESGDMHFHEWELTPEEAASIQELVRYAQVWSGQGESLLRSRYLIRDLPMSPEALRAAAGGELVWREADFDGTPIRSVFYPLVRLGHLHDEHVLQVAAPLTTRNAMLRRVLVFGFVMVLLTALAGLLGGRWLAGRAIRPVTAIIDQAEGMGGGTLRRRISAYADTREYQRLVQVLNTMLDRIQASFEAQRRFTADASHELRSPLTAMRGEMELALRREREPDEYREVLRSAHEEVLRMGRIVDGLLTLARSDAGAIRLRREPVDLADRVRDALERARGEADRLGVALELQASMPLPGALDAGLMGQLVWNLVQNAVRHAGPGGRVRVGVGREEAGNGGPPAAVITVEDTGPGLPPGSEEQVFERFWRGDPSRTHDGGGEGSGLGLAIVKVIAEAHGGTVSADNGSELGGARFRARIPLPHTEAERLEVIPAATGAEKQGLLLRTPNGR